MAQDIWRASEHLGGTDFARLGLALVSSRPRTRRDLSLHRSFLSYFYDESLSEHGVQVFGMRAQELPPI